VQYVVYGGVIASSAYMYLVVRKIEEMAEDETS